jgi:uncharacterized protein (TIGR00369 family)
MPAAIEAAGSGTLAVVEATNPAWRTMVEQGFAQAPFLVDNGIGLDACGPGWCEASLTLTPHHLQHTGVPHAGLIATLADHACGGAAISVAPRGHLVLTTDLGVRLLRGLAARRLLCRAEVVKAGSQVTFAEASVEAELASGERKLVARANVTLSVLAGRA